MSGFLSTLLFSSNHLFLKGLLFFVISYFSCTLFLWNVNMLGFKYWILRKVTQIYKNMDSFELKVYFFLIFILVRSLNSPSYTLPFFQHMETGHDFPVGLRQDVTSLLERIASDREGDESLVQLYFHSYIHACLQSNPYFFLTVFPFVLKAELTVIAFIPNWIGWHRGFFCLSSGTSV